jgi:hypothetical protein
VQANLVLVDVVVTSNGTAVPGLTKNSFRRLENGNPQQITVCEEHKPDNPPAVVKMPDLPPNTYSDFPQFAVTSAVNVLLLDALNTPLSDQMYVRQQMLQYLKAPVKRYLVDYAVDIHPLTFTSTPDGVLHGRLEFFIIACDADGKR